MMQHSMQQPILKSSIGWTIYISISRYLISAADIVSTFLYSGESWFGDIKAEVRVSVRLRVQACGRFLEPVHTSVDTKLKKVTRVEHLTLFHLTLNCFFTRKGE